MRKTIILAIAAIFAGIHVEANAATITFDTLPSLLFSHTYTENGYTFTMSQIGVDPHFGDGGGPTGTLNWHEGGSNAADFWVTLTRNDGGIFDLLSFSHISPSGLLVSSPQYSLISYAATNVMTPIPINFRNVTAVQFGANAGGSVAIDNVVVESRSSVPEPATIALMGLGIAGMGYMRRRQSQA